MSLARRRKPRDEAEEQRAPHLLVAVWIYAYSKRLHSAREIAYQMSHGRIADIAAINDSQDAAQLVPVMKRLNNRWGRYPHQALADGGYTNHVSVVAMDERGIDFYGTMTGRSSAPPGRSGGCQPEYRLDCFDYDEAANEMVCPEGKRLAYRGESQLAGGRWLRPSTEAATCSVPCRCSLTPASPFRPGDSYRRDQEDPPRAAETALVSDGMCGAQERT